MFRNRHSRPLLILSALTLWMGPSSSGLAQLASTQSSAPPARSAARITRITFRPPNRGAPPVTSGAASRGGTGSCLATGEQMVALVPASTLGLSVTQTPSVLVYVPESSAQSLELTLETEDGTDLLYTHAFATPGQAGIVSLDLTRFTPQPLEKGQLYRWYVSLVCDDTDRSGNAIVSGWIEPVDPTASLAGALEQTASQQRPQLYAEAGIWYDAVQTLARLRQVQPHNSELAADWQALLQSVGLNAIAEAPLIDCCTPAI